MPCAEGVDLDTIFCIKKERTVAADNTVAVYGECVQIPPSATRISFAKVKVEVCILEDRHVLVCYKGTIIAQARLSSGNQLFTKERSADALLSARAYALETSRA